MVTARFGGPLVFTCAAVMLGCGTDSPSLSPSALAPFVAPRVIANVGRTTDEPALPNAVSINIVGSVGAGAFVPNPLEAATGVVVTWKNDDMVTHRIVLSDGTEVGTIAPGEASNPVAMSAPSVSYYCTFHPSMTGIISDPSMAPPALPPDDYPPDYYPASDPY